MPRCSSGKRSASRTGAGSGLRGTRGSSRPRSDPTTRSSPRANTTGPPSRSRCPQPASRNGSAFSIPARPGSPSQSTPPETSSSPDDGSTSRCRCRRCARGRTTRTGRCSGTTPSSPIRDYFGRDVAVDGAGNAYVVADSSVPGAPVSAVRYDAGGTRNGSASTTLPHRSITRARRAWTAPAICTSASLPSIPTPGSKPGS